MMACSETSFASYTFKHQWKINDLEARMQNPSELTSPAFDSPPGTQPATRWELCILPPGHIDNASDDRSGPRIPYRGTVSEQYLSLELKRLPAAVPSVSRRGLSVQQQHENDVWSEAHLKTSSIIKKSSRHNVTSLGPMRLSVEWQRYSGGSLGSISLRSMQSNIMIFKRFLPLSAIRGSQSVTFECEIKVWLLGKPIHEEPPTLQSITSESDFNLSKIMNKARHEKLFTDVTLVVADRKEFKAHKVVLASQSLFFKTRFERRWIGQRKGHQFDRVDLTDVPASVMEAILSYMYTGKVADIDELAIHIFPTADQYGLEGLQKMCEESLAKTLTSNNVIDVLIRADAINAVNLKKVCMEYISLNASSVRASADFCKLKETKDYHDLWVELLETSFQQNTQSC